MAGSISMFLAARSDYQVCEGVLSMAILATVGLQVAVDLALGEKNKTDVQRRTRE